MKYSILINQLGIVKTGLHKKTDLVDWAIIDYLQQWYFAERKKTIFVQERGLNYVWVNYRHLMEQMPLLGINDKDALSKRMKKLKELGLIDTFQTADHTLYFILTPKCIEAIGFTRDTPQRAPAPPTGSPGANDLPDQTKTGCPTEIGQGISDDSRTAQIDNHIKSATSNIINLSEPKAETPTDAFPTNQQIIAELTTEYRKIAPLEAHSPTDYAFIGHLYRKYGVVEVKMALATLEYKVLTGYVPEKPLLYLKGILGTQKKPKRTSASVDWIPEE